MHTYLVGITIVSLLIITLIYVLVRRWLCICRVEAFVGGNSSPYGGALSEAISGAVEERLNAWAPNVRRIAAETVKEEFDKGAEKLAVVFDKMASGIERVATAINKIEANMNKEDPSTAKKENEANTNVGS